MTGSKFSFQLDCPVPKFDFDMITLGHGSGGLLTHRLLDAGVFTVFDNDYLREAHDGAYLDLQGKTAFTTDSFVVSPILFPGGNIGELAVNGTVNDVAMCGGIPKFLSLSFILEEGLKMDTFSTILQGVQNACLAAGVQIVTGDTKVVEKGKGDQVFINTTGLGPVHTKANIHMSRVRPGDVVITSGLVATHGIAIMSVREGLEFETVLLSDTTNLNGLVMELLDAFGEDIHFFRDPTRGGVASALNEVTKSIKVGIDLDQRSIPMEEGVEGACEMLGLDPLYVANEGILITIVQREKSDAILHLMRSHEKGKNASIIGEVTEEHPGQVVIRSTIGGRRVVQMLAGEQLPRIC